MKGLGDAFIPFSILMFRNKGLGHKWLKKKRVSLVETKVSIVEKNVRITERFFDNHYKSSTAAKLPGCFFYHPLAPNHSATQRLIPGSYQNKLATLITNDGKDNQKNQSVTS